MTEVAIHPFFDVRLASEDTLLRGTISCCGRYSRESFKKPHLCIIASRVTAVAIPIFSFAAAAKHFGLALNYTVRSKKRLEQQEKAELKKKADLEFKHTSNALIVAACSLPLALVGLLPFGAIALRCYGKKTEPAASSNESQRQEKASEERASQKKDLLDNSVQTPSAFDNFTTETTVDQKSKTGQLNNDTPINSSETLPAACGIINRGFTCYAISTVQALLSSPKFFSHLQQQEKEYETFLIPAFEVFCKGCQQDDAKIKNRAWHELKNTFENLINENKVDLKGLPNSSYLLDLFLSRYIQRNHEIKKVINTLCHSNLTEELLDVNLKMLTEEINADEAAKKGVKYSYFTDAILSIERERELYNKIKKIREEYQKGSSASTLGNLIKEIVEHTYETAKQFNRESAKRPWGEFDFIESFYDKIINLYDSATLIHKKDYLTRDNHQENWKIQENEPSLNTVEKKDAKMAAKGFTEDRDFIQNFVIYKNREGDVSFETESDSIYKIVDSIVSLPPVFVIDFGSTQKKANGQLELVNGRAKDIASKIVSFNVNGQTFDYRVVALVIQTPNHFYAHCLRKDGWYTLNDSSVQKHTPASLKKVEDKGRLYLLERI